MDIENDCLHGNLSFIQVPSYQVPDSSLCDKEMTLELMHELKSVNIRLYRVEISGAQINNDSELFSISTSTSFSPQPKSNETIMREDKNPFKGMWYLISSCLIITKEYKYKKCKSPKGTTTKWNKG